MLIAHISDIHLRSLHGVRPWAFIGQRVLGGLNLLLNRASEYPPEVPTALFADLARVSPDHLVISGDLTNLSLRPEFELVLETLERFPLGPEKISVVPGNHDAYTYGGLVTRDFNRIFSGYLKTDVVVGTGAFPLVHLRGDVAIVGLSSAHPSPPMMAFGSLGERQLEAAERALKHPDVRRRFRLVVVHHAPLSPPAKWHQRLTDADAFIELIRRVGADLVLHGHLHRNLRAELAGPNGTTVPLIGVTSSTWLSDDPERRAAYNLYEIDDQRHLAGVQRRAYDADQCRFEPG